MEGMKEGLGDLGKEGFGIVFFGCGLFLVPEYVLYFLHTQSVLVEEGGTGVACQVPMRVSGDSCKMGDDSQGVICLMVVAYVCKMFQSDVSVENSEGLACKKNIEREKDGMVCLFLIKGEYVICQAVRGEVAKVAPTESCVTAEKEGVAYVCQTRCGWCAFLDKGELLFCEMLVPGCDFRDSDVAEGVLVCTEHVATYGFVDKASKCFQTK